MNYNLHCEYAFLLYYLIPLFIAVVLARFFWYKAPLYVYPLTSFLKQEGQQARPWYKKVFFLSRLAVLALLIFLMTKPQLVDFQTKVPVEGIDIVLALDVSGSMQLQDTPGSPLSRFAIAKKEAMRFVQRRIHDALGIVVFGKIAVTRCPLTLDHRMVQQCLEETNLGFINPDGTVITKALLTAANRLKNSQAKSKVIILLTDGEPTPDDMAPPIALQALQELGIKVYTIAIGNDKPMRIVMYGMFEQEIPPINTTLLQEIAQKTGGTFFHARNAGDIGKMYDQIDRLEKTSQEQPTYTNYREYYVPFLVAACVILGLELLLTTFMWFFV